MDKFGQKIHSLLYSVQEASNKIFDKSKMNVEWSTFKNGSNIATWTLQQQLAEIGLSCKLADRQFTKKQFSYTAKYQTEGHQAKIVHIKHSNWIVLTS